MFLAQLNIYKLSVLSSKLYLPGDWRTTFSDYIIADTETNRYGEKLISPEDY